MLTHTHTHLLKQLKLLRASLWQDLKQIIFSWAGSHISTWFTCRWVQECICFPTCKTFPLRGRKALCNQIWLARLSKNKNWLCVPLWRGAESVWHESVSRSIMHSSQVTSKSPNLNLMFTHPAVPAIRKSLYHVTQVSIGREAKKNAANSRKVTDHFSRRVSLDPVLHDFMSSEL